MYKKIAAFFLVIVFCLSGSSLALAASSVTPTAQIITQEEYYDEYGAKHYRYVDENGNEVPFENTANVTHTNAVLPTSYDARTTNRVTSVKNQNPFGTCWAHAFCASAESSLISQGYATKDSIDLSEAHLSWFSFNTLVAGSSNPLEQDGYTCSSNVFSHGGNSEIAAGTVARWAGFTNESDFPYSTKSSDMEFDKSNQYVSDYQLDSMITYPKSDTASIKNAIIKNGAVATSYYHDDSYLRKSSNEACYYQNVNQGTNHAITVVGWDDDYSKTKFSVTPGGNGAWLVKNSWGTYWGTNGYFWLSYYDTSISSFYEVNAKPAGDYDNNYQYDTIFTLSNLSYSTTSAYMANIFTTNGKETVEGTYFRAVTGCTCTAYLYTDLRTATNPSSGTVRAQKTIECPYAGGYTIDFDTKYQLSQGKKFAIVIKIVSSDTAYVPLEHSSDSNLIYNASSGQSYFSSNGSSWTDSGQKYNGNVPVKAFTRDVTPSSIQVVSGSVKTEYYTTDKIFDTSEMVVRANYKNGRYEDVTSGFTVSSVDLSTAGEKNVTVSYLGKSCTLSITVIEDTAKITVPQDKSTVIDGPFIYGLDVGITGSQLAEDYLNAENANILVDDGEIATGTEVTVVSAVSGNTIGSFTIVIFGDVNKDGIYDGMDSIVVECLAQNMLTRDNVGEAVYKAADCNHDGSVDSFDSEILKEAGLLLETVDQTKPMEVQSVYQNYINLINQAPDTEELSESTASDENGDVNIFAALFRILSLIIYSFISSLHIV